MLEKDPDLKNWNHPIGSIRRSSEHLAGLIEGLLDISRIEAGRIEIMRDRINLPAFLSQIASIFEAEAARKGLTFTMQTHGRLPNFIACDEKRLRQIIINLLSNAIRYTQAGTVTFDLTYRNEVAIISVTDTGCGIPPADIERIWRPFERGSSHTVPGSGLGLTITRLLVEILGGDIEVDSTPGKGSTFSIRLMLPTLTQSVIADQDVGQSTAFTGYKGQRKTIMVVDDDINHLSLADHFLSGLGFVVVAVSTVDAAELILTDASPDILLLDIDMPERDGWSFARSLRAGPARNMPIVMISGHAKDEARPRSEPVLHDAFIAKPYNLDELLLQIAELLKITLTADVPDPAEDAAAGHLLPDDIGLLLEFADIGHAAGLRDKLDELEQSGRCPETLMTGLKARLDVFDIEGIMQLLQETRHELS